MNRRMIFYTVGRIITLEAGLLLLPMAVALWYGESCAWDLLASAAIALVVGRAMTRLSKPTSQTFFAREGFVIVALAWVLMSLIGMLPFLFSGEIPFWVDAFFETVSGFTTTGASILTNVEAMSHGLLFWRSFTHWIGGMGVLVLIMAIVPTETGRSIHIMRAEMPGPIVGKLMPRIKDTAQILYLMYVVLTVVQIVLLMAGGMPPFESVTHAMATAGTGGFSVKADCFTSYSPYLQWVTAIFMTLFGVNFNVYYLALRKKFKEILRSTELWAYLGIILVSIALVSISISTEYDTLEEIIRQSAFQVTSIITTTGYASTNFDLWPELAKNVLLILMFLGACAGSTGGGLKVSRAILLVKMARREMKRMIHPRSVGTVQFEGKRVSDATLNSVCMYFVLYVIILVVLTLFLCINPFSIETNLAAAASCFNNIGPGFGIAGPASNYSYYNAISKFVLTIAMLFGRLEIYPMLLALSPSTWTKE